MTVGNESISDKKKSRSSKRKEGEDKTGFKQVSILQYWAVPLQNNLQIKTVEKLQKITFKNELDIQFCL